MSPAFRRHAIQFAQKQVAVWADYQLISGEQRARIDEYFTHQQELTVADEDGQMLDEPVSDTDRQQRFLHCWRFLGHHLIEMQRLNVLAPDVSHELQAHVQAACAKLSRPPKHSTQPDSTAATEETSPKDGPRLRNRIEQLLDPKTLHTLMCCGGGVLIIGLIGWLWSIGLFDNPVIVAVCAGVGNLAIIAAGAVTVLKTRYRIAGRGVALLGCLVLPLNLWFYDAQGLITLNDGGHLWIPALLCCVIYAAVMRILRDHWFVYTFVGGISMTGLLILADHQVSRFWEVIAPSTLLVCIGVACVHAERLFSNTAEVFKRQTFGKAFFYAGHIVLSAGLAILFGGRLAGLMYERVFADLGWFTVPDVAVVTQVQLIAMLLTLLSTYTYIYSQLAVRQSGRFIYSAILTLLWSEIILLDLLAIPVTETAFLLLISSTAIIANVTARVVMNRPHGKTDESVAILDRAMLGLGTIATTAAAVLASLQFVRFFLFGGYGLLGFYVTPVSVGALLLTAFANASFALVPHRRHRFLTRIASQQTTGVLILFSVLQASFLVGLEWSVVLPLLTGLLVAAAFLIPGESRLAASDRINSLLQQVGIALLTVSTLYWMRWTPHSLSPLYATELICLSSLAMGLFFGLQASRSEGQLNAFLAAGCSWYGIWKAMVLVGFITYAPILAASFLGLLGLTMSKAVPFSNKDLQKLTNRLSEITLVLGGLAGQFLVLNRLLGGPVNWDLFALMIGQLTIAMAGSLACPETRQRRDMGVLSIGHIIASLLLVNALSPLSLPQRFELISTVGGIFLLIYAHVARHQEGDERSTAVTFNLQAGSLFAVGPIVIGLLVTRLWGTSAGWGWLMFHEVGTLLIGLTLLGSGIICRIRSTTLAGGAAVSLYVLSLITLIQVPDQLQTTAVYMMVGGGLFFCTALLMSIYRDRLLAMPDRIREGEGIFRVLKWR